MGILLHEERKNRCTFYVGLQQGRLSNFCSEKVVGALIGVGALKGMNTVGLIQAIFENTDTF